MLRDSILEAKYDNRAYTYNMYMSIMFQEYDPNTAAQQYHYHTNLFADITSPLTIFVITNW